MANGSGADLELKRKSCSTAFVVYQSGACTSSDREHTYLMASR